MTEKITIIIPAYNIECYLNKCIESIVKQTYKDIEIIIVNDGSTDNTSKMCDIWKNKDNRIKYIYKNNGGLSSARNSGLNIATGKYIVFIDSDDFIENNMIEVLYNNIKNNDADISICNRYYYYEKDNQSRLRFEHVNKIINMDKKEALINLMNFSYFDMSAWCKMYKKELFNDIRFPEGKYCEDYYIMYKLFDKTNKIVYDSRPLYYYLQREGSITKKKELLLDYVYASEEQMEYISKKYPELEIYCKSAYALSYLTIYNKVIINGGVVSKKIIKEFKEKIKSNKKYVYNNKKISISRKIQIFMFLYFTSLYNIIIKIYKIKGRG